MSARNIKHHDSGFTSLLGKGIVSKSSRIINVIGSIDEVSSVLGIVRSMSKSEEIKSVVLHIQKDLIVLMGELATQNKNKSIHQDYTESIFFWIEEEVELFKNKVQIPNKFIIPGDSIPGAFLDFARTVIRRAERNLVELFENEENVNQNFLIFLNRLSTLCFFMELYENTISNTNKTTNDDLTI